MNLDLIRAAEARIAGHVRHTPLVGSPWLDRLARRRVHVKAEPLQLTGSFKIRGAWAAVSALPQAARARGVLAHSSGNHAQGVALAAQAHGVPATILMPADAPALKIANTRDLGAEIVLYDRAGGEDRDQIGADLAARRGLTLIPPFDDPEVIAGQGTVGLEVARQVPVRDGGDVLICCGGGGLSAGVSLALAEARPDLRVRPVEPVGFDDMARSLASGRIAANDRAGGAVCDAILTPRPGDLTFPILREHAGAGLTVTDAEALRAMALAFLRLKLVCEPGGAVALAAALFRPEELSGPAVTVIATGGNVEPAVFGRALAMLD